MRPNTHRGYQLLHDGAIALARVEGTGMRVDVKRLDQSIKNTKDMIRQCETKLMEDDVWRIWQRRFGTKANLYSHEQLGDVLYGDMQYPVYEWTGDEEGEGRPSTDVSALEKIDLPFVRDFIKLSQLDKAHGTYLARIKRQLVGDRFHPNFDLHTVQTYRSSSDFQNIPVRDPFVSELLRTNFIASDGHVLVENDYAGIEVKVAACYHKDPVMIEYIKDLTKDMHRDMAAQIYKVPADWVKQHGKQHRYGAKNKFVFPQFYGDYFKPCARNLWEWAERAKLKAPGDISLIEHLRKQGIDRLGKCDPKDDRDPPKGTFERHLKDVEDDFWNNRFRVYGQWKKDWYQDYLHEGGFDTLTGFRIEGNMRRNQVVNWPVQGSAFHCLLWSLIRLNKELIKRKMKSRVICQIHDSIVGDVAISELKEYLDLVRWVMTEEIRKDFRWLIVPLDIENEICPPSGTWFHKSEVKWDGIEFSFQPKGSEQKVNIESTTQFLEQLSRSILPKAA